MVGWRVSSTSRTQKNNELLHFYNTGGWNQCFNPKLLPRKWWISSQFRTFHEPKTVEFKIKSLPSCELGPFIIRPVIINFWKFLKNHKNILRTPNQHQSTHLDEIYPIICYVNLFGWKKVPICAKIWPSISFKKSHKKKNK